MKIETLSLKEALKTEKFEELAYSLSKLPEPKRFEKKAEERLWRLISKGAEGKGKIPYKDLPEDSKKLIGYTTTGEEENLPWWLKSFKWKMKEKGATKTHEINIKFLRRRIQDFHKDSYVLSPEYVGGFVDSLKSFNKIKNLLKDNLELEIDENSSNMPDNFFEKSNGKIKTSENFKNWFDWILELCPPNQPQLTSILLVNSRMKVSIAEEYLDVGVIQNLRKLGMINQRDEIYNHNLIRPIKKITFFNFVSPFRFPLSFRDTKILIYLHVPKKVGKEKNK